MKRALFLAATVASIAMPAAMAQTNTNPGQMNSGQSQNTSAGQMNSSQSQMNQQQSPQNGAQQGQINPEQLSSQQVRQIQTTLKKEGFNTGKADGKWGSETQGALKKFQQQKKLQANGKLDQQTLSALGVNLSSSETTGASSNENSSSQSSSKSRQ